MHLQVADVTDMAAQFPDASFDAVLDKVGKLTRARVISRAVLYPVPSQVLRTLVVCSEARMTSSQTEQHALFSTPPLPYPSQGTLDGLLCSDDDERDSAAMLHEASRVLVPGGMCLLISFGPPATRAEFICAPSLRWRVQVYVITRRLRIRDPDLGVRSAAVPDLDPCRADGPDLDPCRADGPDLDPCKADGPDLDPSRVESSLEFIVSDPVGVAVGEDGELLLRQLPSGTGPVDPVDPAGLRGGGGGETPLAPPGAVGSSKGVVTQLQFPMNSSTLYAYACTKL